MDFQQFHDEQFFFCKIAVFFSAVKADHSQLDIIADKGGLQGIIEFLRFVDFSVKGRVLPFFFIPGICCTKNAAPGSFHIFPPDRTVISFYKS